MKNYVDKYYDNDRPVVCIYHRGCNDGQVAAYIVKSLIKRAVLISADYGDPVPELPNGAIVYIVDFSYQPEDLDKIANAVNQVYVIDHHKTAIDKLNGYNNPKVKCILDHTKSGAMLTWKFFTNHPEPDYVLYAQDYDLWKFEYSNTKPYVRYMKSLEFSYESYRQCFERPREEIIKLGKTLLADDRKSINWHLDNTRRHIEFCGYQDVPIFNVPKYLVSETLNDFLIMNPSYKFAIGYHDTATQRIFRLNSLKKSGFSVRELAEKNGGGGHDSSASFKVDRSHPLAQI